MRSKYKEIFIGIFLFLFSFLSLKLLLPDTSPYDYYTRLAKAFIHGQICLQENPEWLNELIPIPNKGFCVVYPITPALLSMPIVYVLPNVEQTDISRVVFGSMAVLLYFLFRAQRHTRKQSILFALLWNFATIYFSMSAVGSAWYFAQTVGSFFLVAALFFFQKKSLSLLFLSGICFGLAANARLPLHLYAFFFMGSLWINRIDGKKFLIAAFIFGLGFSPIFLIQRFYNYDRYHTFSDAGYYLIPGKFNEEDFKDGEFNIANIPKHFKVLLLQTPKKVDTFPYLVPSYEGLSILFTSPFLLLGLYWILKKRKYIALLTIVSILALEMSHGTVGFTQFGYRFGLDAYPLLFLGFTEYFNHQKNRKTLVVLTLLIIFSVMVNIWGVLSFRNNWFVW